MAPGHGAKSPQAGSVPEARGLPIRPDQQGHCPNRRVRHPHPHHEQHHSSNRKSHAGPTAAKGVSGNSGGAGGRARRELNNDTIREMHAAFRRCGRAAIDKVMRNQPGLFLRLLILLVPRELEVTQSGSLKQMSDEQLEQGIAAIQEMLAKRASGAGGPNAESWRPGNIGDSQHSSHRADRAARPSARPTPPRRTTH